MMDQTMPCQTTTVGMHAFIIIMNVVQTIALAYIAQRAVRKNREDTKSNGNGVK
jgi:hypothetical protein